MNKLYIVGNHLPNGWKVKALFDAGDVGVILCTFPNRKDTDCSWCTWWFRDGNVNDLSYHKPFKSSLLARDSFAEQTNEILNTLLI